MALDFEPYPCGIQRKEQFILMGGSDKMSARLGAYKSSKILTKKTEIAFWKVGQPTQRQRVADRNVDFWHMCQKRKH
jgi:hypothetical protein